jgi:hypothetical protein
MLYIYIHTLQDRGVVGLEVLDDHVLDVLDVLHLHREREREGEGDRGREREGERDAHTHAHTSLSNIT